MSEQKYSCMSEFGAEILMLCTSQLMLFSVVFPVFQSMICLLCRFRKRISIEKLASLFLSTAYTIFLPLLSYMFSQAKEYNLDVRAQVILTWMVYIEIIRVWKDNFSNWELTKSLEQLVRILWVGYLVYTYAPLKGIRVSLFFLCIYSAFSEILKGFMFNKAKNSYLIGKNPKVIHNYMKRVMVQDDLQTTPLSSCNYIVMGEKIQEIPVCSNDDLLGTEKSSSEGILTIGRVFQLDSSQDEAFSSAHPYWRDTCLSLALAKMLRRRFTKLPIVEAGSRKALDFVLEGLIDYIGSNPDSQTDENDGERKPMERVYGIIQEELKFVSDYLQIQRPSYYYFIWYRRVDLFSILIIFGNGFYLLMRNKAAWLSLLGKKTYHHCSYFTRSGFGRGMVDAFAMPDLLITCYLMLACVYIIYIGLMGFTERWLYLVHVKRYIKDPVKWKRPSRSLAECKSKLRSNLANYMKTLPNRETRVYSTILDVSILARLLKCLREKVPISSSTVVHSTHAKKAILMCLKKNGGQLTNGETSIKKYGMEDLNWACPPNGSTTETILIWHIATTLFHNLEPSPQQNNDPHQELAHEQNNNPIEEQEVALALSSYCHYLVNSLPELLPDDVDQTEKMYGSVMKEIFAIPCSRIHCRAHGEDECRCNNALQITLGESSVVGKGSKVAKDLMNCGKQRKEVWKMLAEFWAEVMLFIAPSDNVDGHEKILHKEELITQLWALLTHAGILTRPEPT